MLSTNINLQPTNVAKGPKWIGMIRALPSTGTSEMLKPQFLDRNLNHSRKLIADINALAESSSDLMNDLQANVDTPLLTLHKLNSQLSWLDLDQHDENDGM